MVASRCRLVHKIQERVENALEIFEDGGVGCAEQAISKPLKVALSCSVSGKLRVAAMSCSIGLDDHLALAAEKIDEVGPDRRLPHEFVTAELPVSKSVPKLGLGRRRFAAQRA